MSRIAILDVDGTLVDTNYHHAIAWFRAFPRQFITVRFNANTYPNLPWDFRPEQKEIRVPLGDEHLAFYTARNEASTDVTGVALYNVTTDTASASAT